MAEKLIFSDPVINQVDNGAYKQLSVGETTVLYPAYTLDNIVGTMDRLKRNASDYKAKHNGNLTTEALAALDITNKRWINWATGTSDKQIDELASLVSQNTGTSIPMMKAFGTYPLIDMDFTRANEVMEALKQRLVKRNVDQPLPFGEGYLIGKHKSASRFGFLNKLKKPTFFNDANLIAQYLPGNVVGAPWLTLSLVGPGQLTKLPSDDPLSMLVYLKTLEEVNPELRNTISAGYWQGGDYDIESIVLGKVEAVYAMGGEDAMQKISGTIREINPALEKRTYLHGHKVGFTMIGQDYSTETIAKLVAMSAIANDTYACYSPQNIYVKEGGLLSPYEFAEAVAKEMKVLGEFLPPRADTKDIVSGFRRQTRISNAEAKVLGEAADQYAVIYDPKNLDLQATCGARVIRVLPISDSEDVFEHLTEYGKSGYLQSAEIAVPTHELKNYLVRLNQLGLSNVHAPGESFTFSIFDPHDGIYDNSKLFFDDNVHWTYLNFVDTNEGIERSIARMNTIKDLLSGERLGYDQTLEVMAK